MIVLTIIKLQLSFNKSVCHSLTDLLGLCEHTFITLSVCLAVARACGGTWVKISPCPPTSGDVEDISEYISYCYGLNYVLLKDMLKF